MQQLLHHSEVLSSIQRKPHGFLKKLVHVEHSSLGINSDKTGFFEQWRDTLKPLNTLHILVDANSRRDLNITVFEAMDLRARLETAQLTCKPSRSAHAKEMKK
jgi:hypothetical protein